MSKPKLALYYAPGACSLGPHIAIEETAQEVEYRRVDFRKDEQNSPEYLVINPRGRVPALVMDGRIITEAPAVLLSIAGLARDRTLVPPPGSVAFARCLERVSWINSSLHIAYAQLWRPQRFILRDLDLETFSAQGLEIIAQLYQELETGLTGPWMIGSEFTIADCYMVPFYRFGILVDLPMEDDYPKLAAWKARMISRPAVRRALEHEGLGLIWGKS